MAVTVVGHPLAAHYLTHLRDKTTNAADFRFFSNRLSTILAVEVTRDFDTADVSVDTPLETHCGQKLRDEVVLVPILRAGLGMLEAFLGILPEASVGYLGLERDEETARASSYYRKLPPLTGKTVVLLDPMLATGGSATHAVEEIVQLGPAKVIMACIVAAPEGIKCLTDKYSRVDIFCCARDRELNDRMYIVPGLGDFGDRLFGT